MLITTYFLSYTGSIDKIEQEISKLEDRVKMNKKGLTDNDVLEWIKIAILIIVGYIIIQALLSAA